jgi:hypothetical protein
MFAGRKESGQWSAWPSTMSGSASSKDDPKPKAQEVDGSPSLRRPEMMTEFKAQAETSFQPVLHFATMMNG